MNCTLKLGVRVNFKRAIVRTPSEKLAEGITSVNLGKPEFNRACIQHLDYILALEECGLEVIVLQTDDYPDSTFVEDVALLTSSCGIITQPGAESRKQETRTMKPIIEQFYPNAFEELSGDGTIEAGDIMMVGEHFYIGLSERTNEAGANQMLSILQRHGLSGETVKMSEVLHLKTGLSYLENNNLLISGEFINSKQFSQFNHLTVDEDEAYAANSVWINGTVLVPSGFPKTLAMIQEVGYKTRTVDVSEFQKVDGGLSCLSLRF